jgi:hypothetical protein
MYRKGGREGYGRGGRVGRRERKGRRDRIYMPALVRQTRGTPMDGRRAHVVTAAEAK